MKSQQLIQQTLFVLPIKLCLGSKNNCFSLSVILAFHEFWIKVIWGVVHVLYVLWAWRTQLVSQLPDKCSCLLDRGFIFMRAPWQCCQCCMAGYNLTKLHNNRLLFFHTKWLCGLLCVCVLTMICRNANWITAKSAANGAEIAWHGPAVQLNHLLLGGLTFYLLFISTYGWNSGKLFEASHATKRFTFATNFVLQGVPNEFQLIIVTLQFRETSASLSRYLKPVC